MPKLNKQSVLMTRKGWLAAAGVVVALFAILAAAALAVTVPSPDSAPGGKATEVLAADGKVIGTLQAEQNRKIVPLDQISPLLQKAVIATEDRNFYRHSGVSFKGIFRALFTNVSAGGVEQGGSTITQQYARVAFAEVGRERSIFRKAKEIALAKKIERRYSKDEILGFYLNTVYFGRGAYGAEAAAQTYFRRSADQLDLAQAAYLAGVVRSPQNFQVDKDPEAAIRIRNEVLGDMVKTDAISQPEADKAKAVDLVKQAKLGPGLKLSSATAGFFLEYVRRSLLTSEYGFSEAEVLGGGLKVHTALDLRMQSAAEQAVSSTLNLADDPEAALIAMDPKGNVKAMVGGRDVASPVRVRGFNFAANVRKNDSGGRQAGSAFKPFALAGFIDEGKSVKSRFPGPSEIRIDSPRCKNEDGSSWEVSNFEKERFGTIDLVEASARSVNTIYAQVMDKVVSPKKFIEIAAEAGIEIPQRDEGCALTLGTSTVTPLEMARAFTTFAARGERPDPLIISKITSSGGKTLREQEPNSERAFDENLADTVNYVLQQPIQRGTATGAKIGKPAAGKTGTTQNHVDAWFAGYTPALTAVVWMGFPPDESGKIPQMTNVHGKKVTGGSFPATIWQKFMTEALKGVKSGQFAKPNLEGEVLNATPPPACPSGSTPAPAPAGSPEATPSCLPESPTPTPTLDEPTPTESLPTFSPEPVQPPVITPRRTITPNAPPPSLSPTPTGSATSPVGIP